MAYRFSYCIRSFSVCSGLGNRYSDPSVELQKYLKIPLFRELEKPFAPSQNQMKLDEKLFAHVPHDNEIKFVTSAVDLDGCPRENLPEILFIGQSNAGKSSLLKALLHQSNTIVKISKKPGHTKTLNFYRIGKKLMLVDAPGYGFRQPGHYIQSVEQYLKNRENLQKTFLITDCYASISEWDRVAVKMLEEFRVPYALIMTKIDLVPQSSRLVNLMQLQALRDRLSSDHCYPQPFLVSAHTMEGLGYLQSFIAWISTNCSRHL